MEVTLAEGLLASELSVPEGTTVISRQQQSFIGGTPWLLQTAFYPMTFVTYGADRFFGGGEPIHGNARVHQGYAGHQPGDLAGQIGCPPTG